VKEGRPRTSGFGIHAPVLFIGRLIISQGAEDN